MKMLNLVACLLASATLLCPQLISAEGPDGTHLVVEEERGLSLPDMIPSVVLDDVNVRAALDGPDPSALQQALEDAIRALPPESRMHLGPVLVFPNEAERMNPKSYERMAEALKANPPATWQSMGVEFDSRFITPEILRAGAATDPQERARLFQEAISSLPQELQEQLANGYHMLDGHMLDGDLDVPSKETQVSPRIPRMSIDEAIASLPDEMRESLRGYEDVLAEEKKLFRALRYMPKESVDAAFKVHRLRFPHPVTEQVKAQIERRVAAAKERGYSIDEDSASPPKEVLARIRQQRLIRGTAPSSPRTRQDPLAPFAAFQELAEYEQAGGHLAPSMPAYGVPAQTEAYIGPWGMEGVAMVFADSDFGAPILITEDAVDTVTYFNPNLTIFGRDASVGLTKYRDNEWATSVSAFDGRRASLVRIAAKLNGQQRDDFISFAKDVITDTLPALRADFFAAKD